MQIWLRRTRFVERRPSHERFHHDVLPIFDLTTAWLVRPCSQGDFLCFYEVLANQCFATDVGVPHVCPCRFSLWAIQHSSRQFHSQLNKQPSGRPCVQGAKPFISASRSQGLVCGAAAVCTVASSSVDSIDPESACSLRSRPRMALSSL